MDKGNLKSMQNLKPAMTFHRSTQSTLVIILIGLALIGIGVFAFVMGQSNPQGMDRNSLDTLLLAKKYPEAVSLIQEMEKRGHNDAPSMKAAAATKIFIHARDLSEKGRSQEAQTLLNHLFALIPEHEEGLKLKLQLGNGEKPDPTPGTSQGETSSGGPDPLTIVSTGPKVGLTDSEVNLSQKTPEKNEIMERLEREKQALLLEEGEKAKQRLENEAKEKILEDEKKREEEKVRLENQRAQEKNQEAEKQRQEDLENKKTEQRNLTLLKLEGGQKLALQDGAPENLLESFKMQNKELSDLGEREKANQLKEKFNARLLKRSGELLDKGDIKGASDLIAKAGVVLGASKLFEEGKQAIRARESLISRSNRVARNPQGSPAHGPEIRVQPGDNLQQKINSAPEGAKLVLAPGSYSGNFQFSKPIHLIGTSDSSAVLLIGSGKAVLTLSKGDLLLENITISGKGKEIRSAIELNGGSLRMLKCRIENDGEFTGVYASTLLVNGGHLDFLESEIVQSKSMGIIIQGNSSFNIKRSQLKNSVHYGIWVKEKASGLIQDCQIFKNGFSGIGITGSNKTSIRNNKIFQNQHYGILVYQEGVADVEDNEVYENKISGLACRDKSSVLSENNRYRSNGEYGMISEGPTSIIRQTKNNISGNPKGERMEQGGGKILNL